MRPKFLILILFICKFSAAQITYETVRIDYDSVFEYKNLQVIPIRKKPQGGSLGRPQEVISLSKAISTGMVTISERGTASTENVHWLRINNRSGKPLFIASGEVVVGGRQDRMVTRDTLMMPTGADQYIPTMCVEEGRWSEKEKKFTYGSYANLRLRKVLDQSKNQLLIWKEIYAQLDSSKIKSATLAYNARKLDKKYVVQENEYLSYFKSRMLNRDTTIVGMICISGNRILGSDIFNSTGLFDAEAVALLSGYIEEAIAFGNIPFVEQNKIRQYADRFLRDEIQQEEYLKSNGKLYRAAGKVIHLTSFSAN